MENKDNNPTTPTTPAAKPEQKKGLGRGLAALLGGDDESPFVRVPVSQTAKVVAPTAPSPTQVATPVEQKIEEKIKVEEKKEEAIATQAISTSVAGYQILNVPIEKVSANDEQPRQHFADSKIQELAESICEQGLIQPIIVRRLPDQNYQIVAGERRWRACKMLGMVEIPVIIRDEFEKADNSAKADLASVIENIQRVELNPIELAEAYSKILKNYNYTQDELAKKLGVSRVSVANTLRLQKLPMSVKEAVVEGKMSEGHARALLTLEKEDDISALAQEIIAQGLNVREVEARVRAKIQGPTAIPVEAPKAAQSPNDSNVQSVAPKSPEFLSAEEELRGIFGTKAVLRGNSKGGVIELYYSNEESLHRLLHQLRSTKN